MNKNRERLYAEAGILDDVKKSIEDAAKKIAPSFFDDGDSKKEEYSGTAHVTSPFGPRSIKQLGGKRHNHGGVDIGVVRGTPVYSVYDGVVNSAPHFNQHKGGMGGIDLSIRSKGDDGEFLMQYIHLDKANVSAGQTIKAGQKIGESGTAGTGPHLHLQKRLLPSRQVVPPTHEEEEAALKMRIIDRKDQHHDKKGLHKTKPVIIRQDAVSIAKGTNIYSIRDGIVSIHRDAAEGPVITVADPVFYGIGNFLGFGKGDSFVYSGFSSIAVKDGDTVKKNQMLGTAKAIPGMPGEGYIRITKNVNGRRTAISQAELSAATRSANTMRFAPTGIMSTNASRPVDAPIKGSPGARSTENYNAVIDQFQVDKNPRYTPRKISQNSRTQTFCNIFVSDVTEAMGAPLPHWVDKNGNPAQPGAGAHELNGNASVDWLARHGSRFGWKEVSEEEAQEYANKGQPVVAGQKEIGKSRIGHVAIVRPGQITNNGPAVANAGAKNTNNSQVARVFGSGYRAGLIRYWANLA